MKINKYVILSILFLIVSGGMVWLVLQDAKEKNEELKAQEQQQQENSKAFYEFLPTKGNKESKVHIIEVGDYKCPYCSAFNTQVIPFIDEEYIKTGKVQFHFLNYTFLGEDSFYIAQYAEAIRQELNEDTFWKFHDLVYANQGDEREVWGTEAYLSEILSTLVSQAEVQKVILSVQKGKYAETINFHNQYVQEFQITRTPTIIIDNEIVELKSTEHLAELIDLAVKKYE